MSAPTVSAFASTSLVEAIKFLAYPLSSTYPSSTLNALQQILLSTLVSTPTWTRSARLTLTLNASTPPRAIYAVCIATSVKWTDWFFALGGQGFDLTVERTFVALQLNSSQEPVYVWRQAPIPRPTFLPTVSLTESEPKNQVPISKLSQSVRINIPFRVTTGSVFNTTAKSRTLAQQLLNSEHEKEEADQIFALISNMNTCLISPTPTRENFHIPKTSVPNPSSFYTTLSSLEEEIFHPQSSFRLARFAQDPSSPSPVSSPASSRPSSPLSILSYSSSNESFTSMSTTSSPTSSPTKPKTIPRPFSTTSKHNAIIPKRNATPKAAVDSDIKSVQRYLYQGGQSTVLTGGVMLGGGGASTKIPSPPPTSKPKTRSLVGGKKTSGIRQNKTQTTGSGSGLWKHNIASHK